MAAFGENQKYAKSVTIYTLCAEAETKIWLIFTPKDGSKSNFLFLFK